MKITWQHKSTENQVQDNSLIGFDSDKNKISRNYTYGDSIMELYSTNRNTNFDKKTDEIDISKLEGNKYMGFGVEISSSKEQFVKLTVYKIALYKNGKELLTFK